MKSKFNFIMALLSLVATFISLYGLIEGLAPYRVFWVWVFALNVTSFILNLTAAVVFDKKEKK